MEISDLEIYEQLVLEAALRGMTVLEFAKHYCSYTIDNKYFIYGKRIFAFDEFGNFLDGDYEVDRDFSCYNRKNLISLVGAPKVVKGYFDCCYCDKLTSLEGAPEVVKGSFYCNDCTKLTSLEGAPKVVEGNFCCYDCKNLPSNIEKLEGIKGIFYR